MAGEGPLSTLTGARIIFQMIPRLTIPMLTCSLATAIALFSAAPAVQANGKAVIGRVEWVTIPRFDLNLEARIDTGARNCSLHAFNEKEIRSGGERYVEFSTFDAKNRTIRLKSKVIKMKTVRSTSGETRRRFVIRETVRLGKTERPVFITLNDRTHLEYRFLVGRSLLRGSYLVDVSRSHLLAD